jgi:hypothetical protein
VNRRLAVIPKAARLKGCAGLIDAVQYYKDLEALTAAEIESFLQTMDDA